MDGILLLTQIINGIVTGSMYALMGAGVTLIYGTMRVMNFAHGEFFMFGGYVLFIGLVWFGLPVIPSVFLAITCSAGLAILVERVLISPIIKNNSWELDAIVTTLGLSFILQNSALRMIGEEYYSLPYYVDGTLEVFGIVISYQRILILAVALLALIAMERFLRTTRSGQALRAVSQDPEAASIVGIPTSRIYMLAFALGGLLAGVAAVMLAPIQSVNPWMGAPLLLKAFIVVILGGMGSFRGTIIAGFMIGIVEAIGTTLTSTEWWEAFSFGVLIAIIWFRPEGMFAQKERQA